MCVCGGCVVCVMCVLVWVCVQLQQVDWSISSAFGAPSAPDSCDWEVSALRDNLIYVKLTIKRGGRT